MTFYLPSQSPFEWRKLLADPVEQWKPGFSARTLAFSWQSANGFPLEVREKLAPAFGEIEPLVAIPEHKVPMPGKGAASQTDLWVLARSADELVSIAVEGKVSEPFGPSIDEWLHQQSENKVFRLSELQRLLGRASPFPGSIRYQLLHRSASAILEARRFNARHAVMLVHSFSGSKEWFGDFEAFAKELGVPMDADRLLPVFDLEGVKFWIAWVCGDQRLLTIVDQAEIEAARRTVFQRVGHAVLRLQHIERLLKCLLGACNFDGPIGEINERLAGQTSPYSRDTLGTLLSRLPHSLFRVETQKSRRPVESTEPWVTFSFGFEPGSEVLSQWTAQLHTVKEERNRLIHHFLESHKLLSVDGCDKACVELDSLLERTMPPYEYLLSIVYGLTKQLSDMEKGPFDIRIVPARA